MFIFGQRVQARKMKEITVKQAEKNEIEWINSKYAEVDFVKSDFENEFIVIAKADNQNAGIGRLVVIDEKNIELGGIYVFSEFRGNGVAEKIVHYLCANNPFKNSVIWCLPFDNLMEFYSRFGFKEQLKNNVPNEIIEKHKWCNSNEKYGKEVLLLCKSGE